MIVSSKSRTGFTNLIAFSAYKTRGGLQTPSIALSALLGNIIARAELNVRLFKIIFNSICGNQ